MTKQYAPKTQRQLDSVKLFVVEQCISNHGARYGVNYNVNQLIRSKLNFAIKEPQCIEVCINGTKAGFREAVLKSFYNRTTEMDMVERARWIVALDDALTSDTLIETEETT